MKTWLKVALYCLCSIIALGLVSRLAYKSTPTQIDSSKRQESVVQQAALNAPNAKRDLVLKKVSWQKGEEGLVSVHSFSIYNASKKHGYTTVAVRFSYYSDLGDEVGHVDKTIDKAIQTGETVRIDRLETGVLDQHADGADMEILR